MAELTLHEEVADLVNAEERPLAAALSRTTSALSRRRSAAPTLSDPPTPVGDRTPGVMPEAESPISGPRDITDRRPVEPDAQSSSRDLISEGAVGGGRLDPLTVRRTQAAELARMYTHIELPSSAARPMPGRAVDLPPDLRARRTTFSTSTF